MCRLGAIHKGLHFRHLRLAAPCSGRSACTYGLCNLQRSMLGCKRACGRKPCSAKPSGKLKSKHIKAPPWGGFLISSLLPNCPAPAAACHRARIFDPRITLQNVMLPVPTRRKMTRILSGRGPMIATKPQYSTSFAARRPSAPLCRSAARCADSLAPYRPCE